MENHPRHQFTTRNFAHPMQARTSLGAGDSRVEGLLNFDYYHPAAETRVDATDLSAFADSSIDLIETHHMIEHLTIREAEIALAEWRRVMIPGAFLVITCPDITRMCITWLWLTMQHEFALRFTPRRAAPLAQERESVLRMFVGPQSYPGMVHQSGYDQTRMRELLVRHAFRVDFAYTGFPDRPTPSLLVIARAT
jgi:SAM-dependent methyltransferase